MSFLSMKGRGPDTRLDGAIEYIRKMHESLLERLDINEQTSAVLEDKYERAHGALSSLNRDVKALEAKPEPVIPIMPNLQPLRADISKQQALIAGLNDELGRCLSTVRNVRDNCNDSDLALARRIDNIKIPEIPKIPTLRLSYIWLGSLTLLTVLNTIALLWILV